MSSAMQWLDHHGLALIVGFLVGVVAAGLFLPRTRCYYEKWVDEFKKRDQSLLDIVKRKSERDREE